MKEIKASKEFEIRFSEVDMMGVVWHGSYPLYFEDARERFGEVYGLSYHTFIDHRVFAPLVELKFQYRRPLRYGMKARVDIFYRPTEAAKIIFEYEIRDTADNTLCATGRSVQVFMDMDYQLIWDNPPFYLEWKKSVMSSQD